MIVGLLAVLVGLNVTPEAGLALHANVGEGLPVDILLETTALLVQPVEGIEMLATGAAAATLHNVAALALNWLR